MDQKQKLLYIMKLMCGKETSKINREKVGLMSSLGKGGKRGGKRIRLNALCYFLN